MDRITELGMLLSELIDPELKEGRRRELYNIIIPAAVGENR